MTISKLLEKCKEMPPVKRGLLLIMPFAAVLLFALTTAPHSPSSAGDAVTQTTSTVSGCAVTKNARKHFRQELSSLRQAVRQLL